MINDEALLSAATTGDSLVVEALFTTTAFSEQVLTKAFVLAYEHEHLEVFKLLLEHPDTDTGRYHVDSFFIDTCAAGKLDWVSVLFADRKFHPWDKSNAALRQAAKNNHIAVVTLLLTNRRVSPASKGDQAFRSAAKNGHLAMCRLLALDPRVDVSARNHGALRAAAENGHLDVVEFIVGRRDHSLRSVHKSQALHNATMQGHVHVAKFILETIGSPRNLLLVLTCAAARGHPEILKMILDAGEEPTGGQHIAVRAAYRKNNMQCLDLLLGHPSIRCKKVLAELQKDYKRNRTKPMDFKAFLPVLLLYAWDTRPPLVSAVFLLAVVRSIEDYYNE